jgi:hypothetical protein
MRWTFPLSAAFCVCWGVTAPAQTNERAQQILIAAQLPVSAAQARNEGIPNGDLRAVLEAMRTARVPAHEARVIIDEERQARRDHGPVDNFGAFVQSRLQAGLRGRELAAAIRAEHVARGKGGNRAARAQGAKGRSDAATGAGRATGQKGVSPATKGSAARDKARPTTQKGRPSTDKKRPDTKGRPN